MMNFLALFLVLTTLATAGVFTPSLEKQNQKDDVMVKEGHRTVVVEYENGDRSNTRVFISPQEPQGFHKSAEAVHMAENAEEKLKEATFASEKEKEGRGHRVTPRELVCDAYGKCKHKIASALGKTKHKVYEKANEAVEKAYEVEEEVKEDVKEAINKVNDSVREKSHGLSEKAHETKETIIEGASEISGKAKGGVKGEAQEVKSDAGVVVDTAKTLKGDVEKNASRTMERTKTKVSEKAGEAEEIVERASDEVKHGAHKLKEEGEKDLKEILRRGRSVSYDAFSYLFSPKSMAASLGILQLLGFATAFGMSTWVTFISSYILAQALPRQQFAMVQSKIYPVYFKAMSYSIGVVLLGHFLRQRKRLCSSVPETFQCINLLVSLIMVLANGFIFEPRATKVMFDRMKAEKEEGRGRESSAATEPTTRLIDSVTEPAVMRAAGAVQTTRTEESPKDTTSRGELVRLSRRLKKLNTVSSFLNILALMGLTWHLVHLGLSLLTEC